VSALQGALCVPVCIYLAKAEHLAFVTKAFEVKLLQASSARDDGGAEHGSQGFSCMVIEGRNHRRWIGMCNYGAFKIALSPSGCFVRMTMRVRGMAVKVSPARRCRAGKSSGELCIKMSRWVPLTRSCFCLELQLPSTS